MAGEYPRKHVDLGISQNGQTREEPFEFVPEDEQNPWAEIDAKRAELAAQGATITYTTNYRTLLDRDGYRE
jgi:hypothetical protein